MVEKIHNSREIRLLRHLTVFEQPFFSIWVTNTLDAKERTESDSSAEWRSYIELTLDTRETIDASHYSLSLVGRFILVRVW